MNPLIDKGRDSDPQIDIVVLGRHHDWAVEYNFAELHELVDLDGLIVVVVQEKAYLRDVLDVSDFVAIEKEQKFDQLIHRKVQVILGQCHKSQY